MPQIKTLDDVEAVAGLVKQYKALRHQLTHVYPNMTGLNAHVSNSWNPQAISFKADIAAAITESGRIALQEIIQKLRDYDISVGEVQEIKEIK